jgi:hypothetical protein
MQKSIILSLMAVALFGQIVFAQSGTKPTGNWLCQSEYGNVSLNFISDNQLMYDGEKLNYTISGNTLRVNSEYGWVDYPFELDGKQLIITFPEGYRLLFNQVEANQNKGFSGSDGNAYLSGTLCEYGSSSSYSTYSSYSHTNWVYFDGNGNFKYGSQSSYSGDGGSYNGGDSPETGTYKISGNQVFLTFTDGTSVKLTINIKQDDGRITELMYGDKLYATSLCD